MSTIKNPTRNFDPDDPRYRRKLWISRKRDGGRLYHFYWRRIGIALGILALIGWFALAGAFWGVVKYHRGFAEVRYVDLAFPWRWSDYRKALSDAYLQNGVATLKQKGPSQSLLIFEAALATWPENLKARQFEAAAQHRLGRDKAALGTMGRGMVEAVKTANQTYVQNYFLLAFDQQADDEALAMAKRLLPPAPDEVPIHGYIALQEATALYNRGSYTQAADILTQWRLQNFPKGQILLAECDWERGHARPAIRRLEMSLGRFKRRGEIYITLERFCRDLGLKQDVRRFAGLRLLDDPAEPGPQLDYIAANHAVGRRDEERKAIDQYCADFKNDADALIGLSQFAVDSGQPDLAEWTRNLVKADGHTNLAMFEMALMQASLTDRDYRRTLQTVESARADLPAWNQTWSSSLSAIRAVALIGLKDGGASLAFSDVIPLAPHLPSNSGIFLAKQLMAAGAKKESRQLLEAVSAAHPDDQEALTELVEKEAAAGDRAALRGSLSRLIKMRKPARDALEASLPWMDGRTDEALRAEIVARLATGPAAVQAR